jgi:hypothetical protein
MGGEREWKGRILINAGGTRIVRGKVIKDRLMTKLMNCHGCDELRVTFSFEKELWRELLLL